MPAPDLVWTLERPAWVNCFVAAVLFLAVACLAYLSWYTLPMAFLAWRYRRRFGFVSHQKYLPASFLHNNTDGSWELILRGRCQPLVLQHVWPGPAWITFRFAEYSKIEPSCRQRLLTLQGHKTSHGLKYTVWRSCVGPGAWRQLRIAAGRSAMHFSPNTSREVS